MNKTITTEQHNEIERIKGYDHEFETTDADKEWSDDGAVGIVRSGVCFVFYRGQGKDEFGEGHIPRFREQVNDILRSSNTTKTAEQIVGAVEQEANTQLIIALEEFLEAQKKKMGYFPSNYELVLAKHFLSIGNKRYDGVRARVIFEKKKGGAQ